MDKQMTRRELMKKVGGAGLAAGLLGLSGIDRLATAVAAEVNPDGDAGTLAILSCGNVDGMGDGVVYTCVADYGHCSDLYDWDCVNSYDDCHSNPPQAHNVECAGTAQFRCTNPGGGWQTAYRCYYEQGQSWQVNFECMTDVQGGVFRCGDGINDNSGWEFYCNTDAPSGQMFVCDNAPDGGITPNNKFVCAHDTPGPSYTGDYKCNSKVVGVNDYRC